MPARIDHPAVREQVRLLYLANGKNLTLAANTVGIPIDRAEKWKERGKWDKANDKAANQLAVSEAVGRLVDHAASELADDSKATKLGLSRYARKQAKELAENGKLKDHHAFRNITAGSSQLHQWEEKEQGSGVMGGLRVYSKQTIVNVATAQPTVSPSDEETGDPQSA